MLRKVSFKNQAAVVVSIGPDYQLPFVNSTTLETSYIKITTQDAHNFVAGSTVLVNGLFESQARGSADALSLGQATIVTVQSPKIFTILLPDTYVSQYTSLNTLRFLSVNYYINSSGLGSKYPWTGAYLDSNGWDLYKTNPSVMAYTSDGSLGAYKLSYGDTV